MNQPHLNTDAARLLVDHASLSDAQIDAMTEADMATYLKEHGIDMSRFAAEIQGLKARLSGQVLLAEARRKRLAQAAQPPIDLSAMSRDDMIGALVRKFGRIEDIPLAARNFRSMQRADWESLYIDYIFRRP
jgi:hypothetical protein